jgi:hypothetical protein
MPFSKGSVGGSSDDINTNATTVTHSEEDVTADEKEDEDYDSHNAMPGPSVFRHRYVSNHRLELDRIATDSSGQRRYTVPDRADRASMILRDNAGNGGNGDPGFGGTAQPESSSEHHRDQNNKNLQCQCCCKLATQCRAALEARTCDDWTETILPCWRWLKKYEWRSMLSNDLIAGCSVGVMVVPQSMSYAKLAGLPVEYGLYSALVPVFAYALFGSSRQLAVGPVAILSLLLSTGLPKVLEANGHFPEDANYQDLYNQIAMQTSFLVGVTYIFMGLARLG